MNIRFRRLAALTLSILLALTLLTTGHAQSYSSLVEDVLDRFASNDARCESAPQQSANGIYRCAELLAIIAYELDTAGLYSDVISGTLERFSANEAACESAPQQTVNGSYRCVELLAVIAYTLGGDAV